ncbi:hypothetical protein NX794_05630 [Streptomyces sp. LP11]|uniref:Uncharacterized protein n=1 Tax=Streptomyces pyxinicus TaxID=2970331 RepID=A0ABT2AWS8_9ACTN|nr:hypothetical protein [Streptomyces sp. LP11]MCS0600712.1 hypothetical protein [Streptomyces sp. LP11]
MDWPGFELRCHEDGRLAFYWHRYSVIESNVRHCSQVRLLPQGSDGLSQWVFHLRFPEGPTPGLLVVRVDVPADRQEEAADYTDVLRRHFGIPEQVDDAEDESELRRVPLNTPHWVAAPVSADSEELFAAVMARVEGDAG